MTIQELEKFIDQYGRNIYSFCKKLCLNDDAADELYQDVWLKAMQDIKKIQISQNVKSYLISLAVGNWRNKKKKYAIRNRIAPSATITDEMESVLEDEGESALEQIIDKERQTAVQEAVAKLKDPYRVPILLYYMEEQSVKEIAKELHVPEGTVKRRLWTARKKLSEELEEYINE